MQYEFHICEKYIKGIINQEVESLIQAAKQRVSEHPSAEQVIVVKTVRGNVRFFVNNVSDQKYIEEQEFVQKPIQKCMS